MSDWVETIYKCYNCGAEDKDSNPSNRAPALVIACWKCGAGRGMEPGEQMSRKVGMRVVDTHVET